MEPVKKAVQCAIALSIASAVVAFTTVAAASTPVCPSGLTCYTVNSITEGTGCTLYDAVTAVTTAGATQPGSCPGYVSQTGVLLPVLSGSSTSYDISFELYLNYVNPGTISIIGSGIAQTILTFSGSINSGGQAVDVVGGEATFSNLSLQGKNIQFGPASGVQVENNATLVLSNVQISGFNNSGAINYGSLFIGNSIITGNTATNGAGVFDNGLLSIDLSTISNNVASHYGGGIYEQGASPKLAYVTIGYNKAQKGGGIYVYPSGAGANIDAFHVTIAVNTATDKFAGCGVGGGVYAADSKGNWSATDNKGKWTYDPNAPSLDFNASIISGNLDGSANQQDDLVGYLHISSETDTDGGDMSIVGNPQANTSCQVGNWQWTPPSCNCGWPTYQLTDTAATPTALFGSATPTLATSGNAAYPAPYFALKSSATAAINKSQNSPNNLGIYAVNGPPGWTGATWGGTGKFPGQNSVDQGGQLAPFSTKYCIGAFEYQ